MIILEKRDSQSECHDGPVEMLGFWFISFKVLLFLHVKKKICVNSDIKGQL